MKYPASDIGRASGSYIGAATASITRREAARNFILGVLLVAESVFQNSGQSYCLARVDDCWVGASLESGLLLVLAVVSDILKKAEILIFPLPSILDQEAAAFSRFQESDETI